MMDDLWLRIAGLVNLFRGKPKITVEHNVEYHVLPGGGRLRAETLSRADGYGRILDLQFLDD